MRGGRHRYAQMRQAIYLTGKIGKKKEYVEVLEESDDSESSVDVEKSIIEKIIEFVKRLFSWLFNWLFGWLLG